MLVLVAGSAICRAANVLPNRKRLISLWPPMVAIWKGRSLRCSHPGHWLTANWVKRTGTSTEPARVSSRVTSLSRRSLARPSHRRHCLVIGHQFGGRMVLLLLLGAVNIYTVREQWPSAFSRFGSTNKLQIAISSPVVPKQRPLAYVRARQGTPFPPLTTACPLIYFTGTSVQLARLKWPPARASRVRGRVAGGRPSGRHGRHCS